MMKCDGCGKEQENKKKQWWGLWNYYGVSGTFCNVCFHKVSHDAYGKPNHPVAYRNMVKKLTPSA
jgi:hypothetical protein